jgi:hypothetical protein
MISRTTSGNGRLSPEGPEQLRIATLLARADAFCAQLRITAKWRPGTVRALLVPGSLPTPARLAYLIRPTGGEP